MTSDPLIPRTWLALEIFILDAQSRNLSPRSIRYYRQQVGWFFEFIALQGCQHLDQVTAHHIRLYFLHLQEDREWKPASVQAAARAIRAFLNFCVREELIAKSPMSKVKMPKVTEELKPAFSDTDIRMLLAAADCQRDRALVLCLLDTGCRASEFLAWNIGDVNLITGTVRVRLTKNRSERTVYLGSRARRELIKYYASGSTIPEDPVWRTLDKGTRLSFYGLQSLLKKLSRNSGVSPCNPHRFRRTCALMSLRHGMNVYALQRIMGHSDLSVLRRYIALVDDDLKDAHKQFGAVDGMLSGT